MAPRNDWASLYPVIGGVAAKLKCRSAVCVVFQDWDSVSLEGGSCPLSVHFPIVIAEDGIDARGRLEAN